MRVRFGRCVVDTAARVLSRDGEGVAVSPRAFDLLEILLERRPEVVPHSELRDRLWPGTLVAYSSLARLVSEVRQAIGDSSRGPRLVRTVYGRGYAFSGEAIEVVAACTLSWAGRLMPLVEGENVIGRGDDCQVHIESTRVSRRHARILVAGGQATLEDLGSTNGTLVGAKAVVAPTRLFDGDEILVGGAAVLRFRGPAGSGPTEIA